MNLYWFRTLAIVLLWASALIFPYEAMATGTVLLTESFRGPSLNDPGSWVLTQKVGSSPPCLTAADIDNPNQVLAAGTNIGGCNAAGTAPLDPSGSGVLRLTNTATYQNGALLFNTALPTAGGLDVTFNQSQWGGTHADGLSFFVKNGANTNIAPGAQGGALGYASIPSASLRGVPGGLFGVGFDAYGGYSSTAVGGPGCSNGPGSRPNSIAVRGPDTSAAGDGSAGFCYIAGSSVTTPGLYGANRNAGARKIRVVVDPSTVAGTRHITVYLNDVQRLQVAVPQAFINASTFKFGFAAASGDRTDNHEVWGVDVSSVNPLPVVTVQANNASSAQFAPLTAITFQATGFSGSDTFSTAPSCTAYLDNTYATPVTSATPPGTYVSHCSGGVASGYAIKYFDGVYTVDSPIPYSVAATVVGGNGTVSCNPTTVNFGGNSICTAVPNPGYLLEKWEGDCAAYAGNLQCTLSNIQRDQVSTVSFIEAPHNVTATVVGGNGTVSCTPSSVNPGGSSTCTAVPGSGYQVDAWTGACAAAGSNVQCALTNIHTDLGSTVSFVQPTYSVNANVNGGFGGTVSCTPATVIQGGNSSCTAVPAAGFQVGSWNGACAAAGSNAQCALTNIQADQVSTVSFALIPPATYTVTATAADPYGTASCLPNNVKAGENSTCYAVPQAGFRVKSWTGACASWGSNAQCYLTNIKQNQVATVSFALLPPAHYRVSATVTGGNGAVTCTPGTVTAGGSSACTAVPAVGYQIAGWTGACAATGANALCDLTNIQTDQTATVSFAALQVPSYTVSATAPGGNGTVSCAPSPVPQGGSSACTAVPALGYQVQSWNGACAATGSNVQCALANIQSNRDSTVSFGLIPPNTYLISAVVVLGNGSVSCAPTSVTKGGQSACTAVPDPGWQVQSWGGACAAAGSNTQCFLPKLQKDAVSTVSFGPILPATHSVSATVTGGNGAVRCNPTTVTKNDASTCLAIPDVGYQVQSWTGACAGANSNPQCYLTKIQKDAVSTVSFVALPVNHYSVVATVIGGNGVVSCTPTSVTAGQDSACTAVPEPGYQVQSWSGACLLAGSATQCSLTNIQTDQTATVSFALIPPITYTVTATVASGNGTVGCQPSRVAAGRTSTCTAVPNPGYQVGNWTGACALAGNSPQCVLTNVQTNQIAAVSFVLLPQAIPVLSVWGLGLLSLLMLAMGRFRLRSH